MTYVFKQLKNYKKTFTLRTGAKIARLTKPQEKKEYLVN